MDLTKPLHVITPTLDGPVLQVLARTTQPMSRRQVTRLVETASEAGIRKVLLRLADQGIVLEQRIGSQYSYQINRDHLVWPAIEAALDAPNQLQDRINDHVSRWRVPPLSVELFGSVATGNATALSDIDVLIYRPHLDHAGRDQWDEQLTELRDLIQRWSGNPAEILEVDAETLLSMVAEDEPVLQSPRIRVAGMDLRLAIPTQALARTVQRLMVQRNYVALQTPESLGPRPGRRSEEFRRTIDELVASVAPDQYWQPLTGRAVAI